MNYESSAAARAEIPSKGVRLQKILRTVEANEPASDAYEAFELMKRSFTASENLVSPEDKMEVLPFENMDSMSIANKEILYSIYNSHVMFIGRNGAIDIRAIEKGFPPTQKLFEKNPQFSYQNMKCIFSKPGADGGSVFPEEVNLNNTIN